MPDEDKSIPYTLLEWDEPGNPMDFRPQILPAEVADEVGSGPKGSFAQAPASSSVETQPLKNEFQRSQANHPSQMQENPASVEKDNTSINLTKPEKSANVKPSSSSKTKTG